MGSSSAGRSAPAGQSSGSDGGRGPGSVHVSSIGSSPWATSRRAGCPGPGAAQARSGRPASGGPPGPGRGPGCGGQAPASRPISGDKPASGGAPGPGGEPGCGGGQAPASRPVSGDKPASGGAPGPGGGPGCGAGPAGGRGLAGRGPDGWPSGRRGPERGGPGTWAPGGTAPGGSGPRRRGSGQDGLPGLAVRPPEPSSTTIISTPQQTPAVIRATAASQAAVCAECGIAWLSVLTAQMPSPAVSISEPATASPTASRAVRRSMSADPTRHTLRDLGPVYRAPAHPGRLRCLV
jgi:hypothetical protein